MGLRFVISMGSICKKKLNKSSHKPTISFPLDATLCICNWGHI
jgi:hypothetical protein